MSTSFWKLSHTVLNCSVLLCTAVLYCFSRPLLCAEGSGSLLAYLKSRGWATGLTAGVGEGGYERCQFLYVFAVGITLTPGGLQHVSGTPTAHPHTAPLSLCSGHHAHPGGTPTREWHTHSAHPQYNPRVLRTVNLCASAVGAMLILPRGLQNAVVIA